MYPTLEISFKNLSNLLSRNISANFFSENTYNQYQTSNYELFWKTTVVD